MRRFSLAAAALALVFINGCFGDNAAVDFPPPVTRTPTVLKTATPTFAATLTPTAGSPTITPTITPTPAVRAKLVANRVARLPLDIDDPVWEDAVPLRPDVRDISTGLLTGGGHLNAAGTLAGIADFNDGAPAALELRAVHDGTSLAIRAQWTDTSVDVESPLWLFDGPEDTNKPGESPVGWTIQGADDKLSLLFAIGTASSERGSFAEVGCAAACHGSGEDTRMQPTSGRVDVWEWRAGGGDVFEYVSDGIAGADSGLRPDAGESGRQTNIVLPDNDRSGPGSEWDGTPQDVVRAAGETLTADPGLALLSAHATSFTGDPAAGDALYERNCSACHGSAGEGGIGPTLTEARFRRLARSELADALLALTHPGAAAFAGLGSDERDDLLARLRGFSGVPADLLRRPLGDAADIDSRSNLDPAADAAAVRKGTRYSVIFIRTLDTGSDDDVRLAPGEQIPFGVALMDHDARNHIGSTLEYLVLEE